MDSIPFTLVSSEDPSKIYAFGLEIVHSGGEVEEAVTYRRDPDSGHTVFGIHADADAARGRFGLITPLTVLRRESRP